MVSEAVKLLGGGSQGPVKGVKLSRPEHHLGLPAARVAESPGAPGSQTWSWEGGEEAKIPPWLLGSLPPTSAAFTQQLQRPPGGFHTQSPGPPCSKQLNLFNDSGGPRGGSLVVGDVSLVSGGFLRSGTATTTQEQRAKRGCCETCAKTRAPQHPKDGSPAPQDGWTDLSIHPSVCPPIYPSIHLSVHQAPSSTSLLCSPHALFPMS